jgi:hypothetical protein
MNSEALKAQLVHETREKSLLVESAKLNLTNTVETLRKDLNESAQSFRSDLRDEMKKAREAWEETTKAERQKWERTARQAEARLSATRRKYMIWGSAAALLVAVITAGLSMGLTWASVNKGTGAALNSLQQIEAEKLADLRAQVVATQSEATAARQKLEELRAAIEKQKQLLAAAKERASHITNFPGKNGEIYVEIPANAQPFTWDQRTLILTKTNTNN